MYCDNCGAELPEGRTDCLRCSGADGRGRRTVIRLGRAPDNDIVLEAPSVSRYHAELRRDAAGKIRLVDLHSQAGTFVDGTRSTERELKSGNAVALGTAVVPVEALRAAVARLLAPEPQGERSRDTSGQPERVAEVGPRTLVGVRRALTHAWTRVRQPVSLGGVVTLGVFNVIFGAVGLAIPALFWLGWRLDEGAPGGTDWFLVLAAASAAHQVVLVLGGIGLILTRRWGRIISLFWAGLSAAAVLVVVAMALLGSATDLGALGQAAALGIAGVLVIYPVLLLFLLNIPSYRAALGLRTPPLDCVRVDGDSLREHLREPAEARR